jgi:hypothetical protein
VDTETFWSMIDIARQQSEGNIDRQIEALTHTLSKRPIEDIQEFERILWTMMARAYRADLWQAAWLIACGCSDDGFHEFRGWLIAQGQVIFERVLEDPQHLADIVDEPERLTIFAGHMTSVAEEVYEQLTGQWMQDGGYLETPVLVGEPLKPENELPTLYPRITEKFHACDDEEYWYEFYG